MKVLSLGVVAKTTPQYLIKHKVAFCKCGVSRSETLLQWCVIR